MEQLREEFPRLGEAVSARVFDACDEPHHELPPALGQPERRMQARAYSFWAAMLRGRSLPSIFDCDPGRARDFEANSVLLDVTGGGQDPAIRSLGGKLAEQSGIAAPIARLSEVPEDSLLAAVADHTRQSLVSRAPFGFESELVNQRGAMILYRGIVLPFSSDERSIDFVLCAVNWKEFADPELAEALHQEIRRAISRDPIPPRRDEPLTEWADGPASDAEVWATSPEDDAGARSDLFALARALAAEADAAEQHARDLRHAANEAERRLYGG